MILTVDEARKRWCPDARMRIDAKDAGFNRGWGVDVGYSGVLGSLCLTSDCMAWRWAGMNRQGNAVGYCGRAGVPSDDGEDK